MVNVTNTNRRNVRSVALASFNAESCDVQRKSRCLYVGFKAIVNNCSIYVVLSKLSSFDKFGLLFVLIFKINNKSSSLYESSQSTIAYQ